MPGADSRERRQSAALVLFIFAVKLAVLLMAGERYGYMSDELYILDAADRLAPGYVDFPPLVVWLVAGLKALGLDSIFALRAVAALLGVGVTLLAVDLCRLLGGGLFARWLTALVVLFAPGFLAVQSILTMNGLDQIWWFAAFWLTARWVQSDDSRHVLLLGVVLGLGVLSKLSILALAAALPMAFLFWKPIVFRRAAIGYAALITLGLAAPFIIWQVVNDYPFIDFVGAYNRNPPKALVLQNPLVGMLLTRSDGRQDSSGD